ncbi:LysR substrate-binding domain-containing protein [Marinobacter sp. SS21]|uniref:LysR substrate-binding domain-containing protein n=1 Tax=Marinobacter sp. SS21 TaxID=2979460 RepID=UPI00232F12EE|nr:LysR substrate-binding domain-containing protein [Marinobacter sp. SS21]MDC0662078.1 LysR substrate-binding domain-containing protein [Marinobacter sp. SS21]
MAIINPWEGVSEFVAVAETESFTQAGKRLGASTAHVSRQVRNLEERLACKLFHRTTRKVSLTEVGNLYYQRCRSALDGLEEAERAVTNLHNTPRGSIKLTAPVTYGEEVIAPLVNTFVARYPELSLHMELTNRTVDLVDGGFDLAIRLGRLQDSSLVARKLATRTLHVCGSPEYIRTHGRPHSLSELDRHNCLVGSNDFWRFRDQGRERIIRVHGRLHCNSGKALTDAALKGIGLVQLPDYYVEAHLQAGRLISMLEPYQEPEEGIWAVYPHARHQSTKVRMLVDYLMANVTEPASQSSGSANT